MNRQSPPDRDIDDPEGNLYALVRHVAHRDKLVVFVHGYDGDYIETWGLLPYLLRDHADRDPILADWDYLFVGYQTLGLRSSTRVADELMSWITKALSGARPFTGKYTEIALVGHSFGTLAIRYYLLKTACARVGVSASAVSRAILIGQVTFGSSVAEFLRANPFTYFRKPAFSELLPSNGFTQQLASWGHCATSDARHLLCDVYVYDITSEDVVNSGSGFWATDSWAGTLPGDHVSAVKANVWSHAFVDALRDRLK